MALNKKDVIGAALAILDEYGLADLTMRRLADSLDVKAGALYWHIANKQSLLAELVTTILDGRAAPAGPWRESLAVWAGDLRTRLLAHRDSADLLATMRAIGLAATDLADGPTGVLTAAGLDAGRARLGAHTLIHFVTGHVNEEQQRAQLAPLTDGDAATPSHGGGEGFRAGVDLLLDGIAVQLGGTPGPSRTLTRASCAPGPAASS